MRSARIAIVIACSLAALALCLAPAQAEKRIALVIGNGDYKNASKLTNPINDAKAISGMLHAAGFDAVETYENLGIRELRQAVSNFADLARTADTAVVYYSGHGIEVNGVNYLVPIDAVLARDIDVPYETFSVDNLVQVLEPARRLRLVMLDACRDNPFVRSMKRSVGTRAVSRGLAAVEPTSVNTMIGFAAKAGSFALDGEGVNSPYAAAVLNHLATPGLDVRIAFGRVRDEVMTVTKNRQEPFVYGSLGGTNVSIVHAPSSAGAAPLQQQAPSTDSSFDRADRAWATTKDTTSVAILEDFIRQFGSTPYGSMARARLQELKKDQVAAVAAPDTARLLQIELKRVGCIASDVNGEWNAASRNGMAAFNRNANTKFAIEMASTDALDAVRKKNARVCPLECEAGFRPEGDKCVAVSKTTAAPPAPRRDAQQPQSPQPPSSSGQTACDRFGCRAVPPGCRIEMVFDDKWGTQQQIVCR